ncbi:MAG: arylsulfatase [Bacteroidia bacterium]|nr:arylsulfatase [Bacteroidia bacterium]
MKVVSVSALVYLNISFNADAQNKNASVNANSKPNVIYIFADDLGYGDLGCYGQKKIQTPNLDRLASEGIRFTQHYVGAPVCAPSRCNLLTGQHSGHAYIRNNLELGGYVANKNEPGQFPIPENTPTIANLFKQAGYATAAIGKWGLGNYDNEGDPLKHGFDYYYGYYDQKHAHNYYPTHLWKNGVWDKLNNPEIDVHPVLKIEDIKPEDIKKYFGNEYSIDKMTVNAVNFIQQNKNKPFFLYLAYTLPHVALQAPEADIEYYKELFQEKQNLYFRMYIPSYYPLSTYAAMITYLDKQVKIIEDLLKKLDLDQNTIVMFCSDNGPINLNGDNDKTFFNSSGSLRGMKTELYEGGIREPFFVKWPGKIAPGQVTNFISATYDMMETFAELLQVQAPHNDGLSILPTLLGNSAKQKQRDYLYWEFPAREGQVAVRLGNWKGIKTNILNNPKTPWQIYNLEADPKESVNLVDQHPELVKKFDEIVQKEHTTPVRPEWDFIK